MLNKDNIVTSSLLLFCFSLFSFLAGLLSLQFSFWWSCYYDRMCIISGSLFPTYDLVYQCMAGINKTNAFWGTKAPYEMMCLQEEGSVCQLGGFSGLVLWVPSARYVWDKLQVGGILSPHLQFGEILNLNFQQSSFWAAHFINLLCIAKYILQLCPTVAAFYRDWGDLCSVPHEISS